MENRKDQYVPDVSEDDIERIVKRDFAIEQKDEILTLIRQIKVREKTRVVLACLKIADGNLEKLQAELSNASGYWREIVGQAEYPNYTKKWFHDDKLPAKDRDKIIEKDRKQYQDWLNREAI